MGRIFVTSDLHFGHDKPFIFEPRGFNNICEHDEAIIKNWNSVVEPDDEVFVLGDLMLGDNAHGVRCLRRLNGTIYPIVGNHDTNARLDLYERIGMDIYYATRLKHRGCTFYLSHYPTLTSNLDADKPLKTRVINLCGHVHTTDKWADWDKGLIYHCELDAHDNKPILLDDIVEDIKEHLTN